MNCFWLVAVPLLFNVVLGQLSCQEVPERIQHIRQELKKLYLEHQSFCIEYGTSRDENIPISKSKLNHQLQRHTVCRAASEKEKVFVHAHIFPEDIGQGTVVEEKARMKLKTQYKECGCENAGHIIAREFGGPGKEMNLFPQNGNLNMGSWSKVNNRIGQHIQKTLNEMFENHNIMKEKLKGKKLELIDVKTRYADLEIGFKYDDPDKIYRPNKFLYKIVLYTETTMDAEIFGEFENVDHSYSTLHLCEVNTVQQLYDVVIDSQRFEGLKTCRVEDAFKKYFEPICPANLLADSYVDPRCADSTTMTGQSYFIIFGQLLFVVLASHMK